MEQDDVKRADQFKKIQAIASIDLPNLALVALPTVNARSKAARSLVTTIDATSSDFAGAWPDV